MMISEKKSSCEQEPIKLSYMKKLQDWSQVR